MSETTFDTMTAERPRDDVSLPDGRSLRAERSRKCIVDALITLIRNREIMPSAERVSEEAKVGLRTVFRHFEDMDSLYQEVGDQIDAQIQPIMRRPFTAGDWRGQIVEMIDRRAEAFEWVMPFKVQANARLLQSDYLKAKHRCAVDADIERLCTILPSEVKRDETLFDAFLAALSFDVWYRLRQDQGRTVDQAKAAVRRLVDGLLAVS